MREDTAATKEPRRSAERSRRNARLHGGHASMRPSVP